MRIARLCSNGTGGLDWLAVPLWCGVYGVTDVEDLMHRMSVIKLYRREDD